MFAPLVLPEALVVAGVVFPVDAHVVEDVVAVVRFEDLGDVFVLAILVAVGVVGSVAVIWPVRCVSRWGIGCGRVAYQRPWRVQWFAGPVAGLVSQNWVWSICIKL